MEKDVEYISYFQVFNKHKVRIIIGTILAFVLMFVWCALGIPPMKKKWKGTVGIVYPLQKSSLAIKRTLGSLDIPVGGLGGILSGSGSAYNNIPILQSRRVLIKAIDSVDGVREELDPGNTMDDYDLTKALKKKIKVDDSTDGYLEVTVFWENSKTAADLANKIVQFMHDGLEELNAENAHFMTDFLSKRLVDIETKMNSADEAVRKFKEESEILAVDEQATEMIKTYAQLQLDMTQAEMEFIEAATRYKLINDEKGNLEKYIAENVPRKDIFDLSAIKDDPAITLYDNGVVIDQIPAVKALEDDGIASLRKTVSELTLELEHKRLLYTDDHPEVITLTKRIYDAKRALYQELENYTRSSVLSLDVERLAFQAKRDVISSIVKDLDNQMKSFPASEATLIRLIRNQDIYQELYMLMVQENEQALLAEQRPETTFQILDPAVPLKRPARPRKMQYSMGFAILAFTVLLMHSFYLERKHIVVKHEE
jgi:uncharacterized protein involved in exopolysaccharide biosynthesis